MDARQEINLFYKGFQDEEMDEAATAGTELQIKLVERHLMNDPEIEDANVMYLDKGEDGKIYWEPSMADLDLMIQFRLVKNEEYIGSISFPLCDIFKSTNNFDQWFTIFDTFDDDEFDGDIGVSDEETPMVHIGFKITEIDGEIEEEEEDDNEYDEEEEEIARQPQQLQKREQLHEDEDENHGDDDEDDEDEIGESNDFTLQSDGVYDKEEEDRGIDLQSEKQFPIASAKKKATTQAAFGHSPSMDNIKIGAKDSNQTTPEQSPEARYQSKNTPEDNSIGELNLVEKSPDNEIRMSFNTELSSVVRDNDHKNLSNFDSVYENIRHMKDKTLTSPSTKKVLVDDSYEEDHIENIFKKKAREVVVELERKSPQKSPSPRKQITSQNTEIKDKEIAALKEELSQMRIENNRILSINTTFEKEVKDLRHKVRETEGLLITSEGELAQAQKVITSLKRTNREIEIQLNEKPTSIVTSDTEVRVLKEKISSLMLERDRLDEINSEMRMNHENEMLDLNSTLTTLKNEIGIEKLKAASSNEQLAIIKRELDNKISQIKEKEACLRSLKEDKRKLEFSILEGEATKSFTDINSSSISRNPRGSEKQIDKTQDLNLALATAQDKIEVLNSKIKNLTNQVNGKDALIEEKDCLIKEYEDRLNELEGKLNQSGYDEGIMEKYNSIKESLEEDNNRYQSENRKLKETIGNLLSQTKQQESELTKLRLRKGSVASKKSKDQIKRPKSPVYETSPGHKGEVDELHEKLCEYFKEQYPNCVVNRVSNGNY